MGPIFVRYLPPEARVWRGRKLLAVLDALAWPVCSAEMQSGGAP
jgi:hypothetical protein